jgi:GNAT superfamily N-acetyltransferase
VTAVAFEASLARVSPTVRLVPMSPEQFARYRATSEQEYAEQIRESGSLPADEAAAKAADDFARLLPDGLATPDHRLWTAYDDADDGVIEVGMLWLHLSPTSEGLAAFGYDLSVRPDLRGRGYGRAIVTTALDACRDLGVVSVALNVFGQNLTARSLYEDLGFEVTSIQMRKVLARTDGPDDDQG